MNQNINKCAHCETSVTKNSIYEKDSGNYFCCDGCRAVYHLINNEGFSSFYSKRYNWQEGPVEKAEAKGEYFEGSLKILPNGDNELSFLISGIRCASCIWLIETSVSKDDRIKSVRINYANHKARIIFDPKSISLNEVLEKVTRLGYCPLPSSNTETQSDKERKDYFYRFGVAAFFSMQLMLYSVALYAGYFQGIDNDLKFMFQIISWVLATPVLFYSALPFFRKSISALKQKHCTMDTLVALGSGCAYCYSIAAIFLGYEVYFDTAATIITLILLGRFIEAGAKQKGGNAVNKLLSLRPLKVKVLTNRDSEETQIIPIEQLMKGDYFKCFEGESIAADGKIFTGVCEINESMLTGEPLPVLKERGDHVFAGTKLVSGDATIIAENVGHGTFLSKIATSVDDAQSSKAPIQDVADRFIGKFVPVVLIVAFFTFTGWYFLGELSVSVALMRAVSVLVIACPCAMGLATPLAVIVASGLLSEKGIVFKSGEAIERFASVNDFYFDKTGTITKGEMKVADVFIPSVEKGSIEDIVTSVAFYSKHPASKAVSLINQNLLPVTNLKEIAGKGVEGVCEGKKIVLGSLKFILENIVATDDSAILIFEKRAEEYRLKGFTVVFISVDGMIEGVFAISDTIRDEAKITVDELKFAGNSVTILTGDNYASAKSVLTTAGINANIRADISPFEKAEIIKQSKQLLKTAMTGDGINDAIALTSSAVGISMRNGTDISMESASAVLLRNDLTLIPKAHKICKKSFRIIKENLFWAFSYNIIAIPLAVAGLIHPIMSAAFMSVSSLIVVANSSRIKRK